MVVETILIIDDNEVDRFLHEAIIRRDYPEVEVLQAFDGLHALEILKNTKPDVIFLDINMPRMNGIAFLEEVSKKNEIPPIYMLTSLYQDCDRAQIDKYSAVIECLEKPLTSEMISRIMKT